MDCNKVVILRLGYENVEDHDQRSQGLFSTEERLLEQKVSAGCFYVGGDRLSRFLKLFACFRGTQTTTLLTFDAFASVPNSPTLSDVTPETSLGHSSHQPVPATCRSHQGQTVAQREMD